MRAGGREGGYPLKPIQVRLGDGSKAASSRNIQSAIKLGRGLSTREVFHVLSLNDQFDVVLGCAFLRDTGLFWILDLEK